MCSVFFLVLVPAFLGMAAFFSWAAFLPWSAAEVPKLVGAISLTVGRSLLSRRSCCGILPTRPSAWLPDAPQLAGLLDHLQHHIYVPRRQSLTVGVANTISAYDMLFFFLSTFSASFCSLGTVNLSLANLGESSDEKVEVDLGVDNNRQVLI